MRKFLLALLVLVTTNSFSQNYNYYLNSWYSEDLVETKEYYYDEDFKVVADFWQNLSGEAMIIRDTLSYDENGNVTKIACHQLYNGAWLYANYVEYTYNELNQRLTRDNYNNLGGSFQHGGTYYYSYDDNGNLVHHEMTLGTFGLYETADYSYDENNNLILLLVNCSDFSGGFNPSTKVVYSYNEDGFLIDMINYYYEAGSWTQGTHKTFERDENNNITVEESLTPYNEVVERHLYEYDLNILFDEVAPYVNPEGELPNPERTTNAPIKDSFYTQDNSGTLQFVCDYYYYYKKIEHEGVSQNFADNINIYPNPVKDVLNIEASEYKNIKIYDLSGKCIVVETIDKIVNIDMSQMPKGMYFVRMNNDNNTITKKIVLE